MSKNHYIVNLINYINKKNSLKRAVLFLDTYAPKVITWIFYFTLAYLAIKPDIKIVWVALIPWITFFSVTIIRNCLNLKRPFEELNFNSLLPHSAGRGCPSRHASSSVIIAIAVYYVHPTLGIITGLLSLVICCTRVLTGVHYPRDVIWGAIIGVVFGFLGFFVIL
ncbi:MAG: phosphatase PAP2 family protein [Lachnospiraceae bacterium]|nr:phosphatase PAP2 family protein [Lachnospiraceae bacterium]